MAAEMDPNIFGNLEAEFEQIEKSKVGLPPKTPKWMRQRKMTQWEWIQLNLTIGAIIVCGVFQIPVNDSVRAIIYAGLHTGIIALFFRRQLLK